MKILGSSQFVVPVGEPLSDLGRLVQTSAPAAEALAEYAGRLCYRSTDRLGHAPGFLSARIDEGHADIIEHAWATLKLRIDVGSLHRMLALVPYLRGTQVGSHAIVSGNLRAWADYIERGRERARLAAVLAQVAPAIFKPLAGKEVVPESALWKPVRPPTLYPTVTDSWAVYPLAVSLPDLGGLDSTATVDRQEIADQHISLSFLIEGVSRALTHQLVRHRVLSFSQESQRYVDLEKGGWQAVIPPAVAAQPEALGVLERFWAAAEDAYALLRALGIRKEDARYLLPNAASTRLVATGNVAGWQHFIKLRADKAAQWEIRGIAEAIRETLLAVTDRFVGEASSPPPAHRRSLA